MRECRAHFRKRNRKMNCALTRHVCSPRCTQINKSLPWSCCIWYQLSTYSSAAHDLKPAAVLPAVPPGSFSTLARWLTCSCSGLEPAAAPSRSLPSRHRKQPLLSLSGRMMMMMRAHRAGYFMPNTSRFGSGPDQMPSLSLLRKEDNEALEEQSKSRRSQDSLKNTVNEKSCLSSAEDLKITIQK